MVFWDECKNKNCLYFLRSDCKTIKHPLEDKIKNIYLSESHEWKYKNKKDLNIGNSIDLDLNCEANLAVFGNSAYNKAEIDSFLYHEKCENCQYNGQNANCQFKSENTLSLLETLKVLYLTLETTIDKNLDFPGQKLINMNEIFNQLCFGFSNITKLMMTFYFTSVSLIEYFYQQEHRINSMENISPVFYNCTQQIRLKITPDY